MSKVVFSKSLKPLSSGTNYARHLLSSDKIIDDYSGSSVLISIVVDQYNKDSLLKTMIHRAYSLSSTTEAFNAECAKLRSIFSRLDYPMSLIDSAIKKFFFLNSSANKVERNNDDSSTVRIRSSGR